MNLEKQIKNKALELGYEKCGVVSIGDLSDYDRLLEERINRVTSSKKFYESQRRLTNLRQQYPWGKSVVVTVSNYGHYKVPDALKNHIGKHYIFDGRSNPECEEYSRSIEMNHYLQELGMRTLSNRHFGVVGMRWAAERAGLGVIRKNNFFYTESGSAVTIEGWITDKDMELIETNDIPPCPQGCSICIKACPTSSLSAPFVMNPVSCVSFLTTFTARDLTIDPIGQQCGPWIYGCDTCQDVCPFNKDKWIERDELAEVSEIAKQLVPERIVEMDEAYYVKMIQPKFFYLKPDELWKWKINALNFMRNNYDESYRRCIINTCRDENERVRAMAEKICSALSISPGGRTLSTSIKEDDSKS